MMVLSFIDQSQLALLKDIYEVSELCSTRTYIWAGLVRDVITGKFLRGHGDVDGFTLNLWDLKDKMADLYKQRGYEVTFLHDVTFMRIDRDGVHAMFNRLEVDGDTAMWRHIGNEGTVYFPKGWLADQPHCFYGAQVFVSGVEFEYAIKTHPQLLSPLWKGRQKDVDALDWLKEMLAAKGVCQEAILQQIWSYNPYWAKRGYKVYSMPVVASRLEPISH
jgi:hypothetical protein